jgi:quinol monooxygenase YgiN
LATILAHIIVKEGMETTFEDVASELFRSSHGTEKALRAYGYWRGAEPRSYYTLLAFDDYMGFVAHQSSSHHEQAAPALRDCIESMSLEWVDPIEGASTLRPTNTKTVAADAPALAHRYATTMPAKVADWWHALRQRIEVAKSDGSAAQPTENLEPN